MAEHATVHNPAIKEQQTSETRNNLDGLAGHCVEWEKPVQRGDTLEGSICMTLLK